jgi:hypothetical protein
MLFHPSLVTVIVLLKLHILRTIVGAIIFSQMLKKKKLQNLTSF